MAELIAAAVRREAEGAPGPRRHAHRVPLGLLLVEQGQLSAGQLREALLARERAERESGKRMLLGQWLIESGFLDEANMTRALGAQWNCPVFPLDGCRPEDFASLLPAFLAETLGALPLRLAAGRLLYLAFRGAIDRSLCYAVERVCGLSVLAGVSCDSAFESAQKRFLAAGAPPVRLLEAANAAALVRAVTRLMEAEKPAEARLIRIHGVYWLRMWRRAFRVLPAPGDSEDMLCTLGGGFQDAG